MWSPRRIAERRTELRAHALNRAIRELPLSTREAMLAAADADELIAGAYTDGHGRACPMLAAHRRGARTHVRGFPRAWDLFTRARRPRRATARELEVLRALLQESIDGAVAPPAGGSSPVKPGQVLSEL
jgi:hypothetical protein